MHEVVDIDRVSLDFYEVWFSSFICPSKSEEVSRLRETENYAIRSRSLSVRTPSEACDYWSAGTRDECNDHRRNVMFAHLLLNSATCERSARSQQAFSRTSCNSPKFRSTSIAASIPPERPDFRSVQG